VVRTGNYKKLITEGIGKSHPDTGAQYCLENYEKAFAAGSFLTVKYINNLTF